MRLLNSILKGIVIFSSVGVAQAAVSGADFYHALLMQDVPKIKELIAKGADVNHKENGRPMLVWAAQSANVELVQALLDGKADVNAPDEGIGHSPLMRAVETQNVDIVKVLLKAKADPNAKAANGESVIGMAVRSGKADLVEAVIQGGADVKVLTADGESPVLLAAMDNLETSAPIIRILAKAGADLNAANIIHTPLTYAAEQGNIETTTALLESGANPNLKSPSGRAPLEYADKKEVIDALLKAKADPNQETESGTSPLIRMIEIGDIAVVESLIKAGADVNKASPSGDTPVRFANNYGKPEIVELLKKHGATE